MVIKIGNSTVIKIGFINLNENIIIKSAIIVLPIISCFSVNKYNNLFNIKKIIH